MSVLIEGMEMPLDENDSIHILRDGTAVVYRTGSVDFYKAISVPEHGGLVDLKAPFNAQYYDEMTEDWSEKTVTVEDVLYGCMVDEMPPTIIPADPADKEAYND